MLRTWLMGCMGVIVGELVVAVARQESGGSDVAASPPAESAQPGSSPSHIPHTNQLRGRRQTPAMSYYFAIVGTRDNPLFEHEFGTSRGGGDGIARFRDDARHMNQFIVHSSLDIVEEVQWGTGQM